MNNSKCTLSILLIDDDDVALEAVQRSLRKHNVFYPVYTACDGLEGLAILRETQDVIVPKPYLVLLDLNMPRMNGFEFLNELRSDALLKETVVFVLTTSNNDADRNKAYNENIAGYMVKSAVGPQFQKLALLLEHFSQAVVLP
ncbi:MAG: response regulator [Moraxellaceae bacterium]|jgi:CheY-like chemotaxis protein|nr:MAG: response regulator [Moraxellaceae bacterium]